MVLDPNQHQGFFGESFVRALAAAAGLTVAKPEPDVTGEDFILTYKGELAGVRHPRSAVQVKSCIRDRVEHGRGAWKYPLRVEQFNQLAGADLNLTSFLVLVLVPRDAFWYATAEHGATTLRHSPYWVSLRDRQPIDPQQQSTVTVDVPFENLLTGDALLDMMKAAAENELVTP